ncbi:MAG: L-threonylcarbamoyladenylate synthase [Euryarchaeota archaeon]|jgi:L-threonylcarbamoyladenylate synthase|nr:L-threonylcarbamoyladenylate synthase [Euryarchaeota archaeon]MBT3654130.1 L-threonylcarbamoyladenylate synthase [Euryarchaeota archaeon]MBT3757047.1 L-threonylcarbamoyladenylate synthase [Euryarchaeota archaeon]MBT4050438.1 L-threonylcarbamoyladenylate synthase [Euryarchaeota archaeon]MBT4346709.1 L-threonylcarbamoyladenylate synthase [Euryarchaeota archaeon]
MNDAITVVEAGGIIVYPTSTQPALGCLPTSAALDKLFNAKNRSAEMPVSLGVANLSQAAALVEVPEMLEGFLASFPKGAITVILPALSPLDSRLGEEKIAIRVVSHPTAKTLLQQVGPLTATSANISGEKPYLNCKDAAIALSKGKKNLAFIAGICSNGPPSTLISWHSACDSPACPDIVVLREGLVKKLEIQAWLKNQI